MTDNQKSLSQTTITPEMWEHFQRLSEDHHERQQAEIERLRSEIADLRCSVIAFGAPAMVEYASERGLPKGHLYPTHYDILERAGARMVSFTRAEMELQDGQ